MDLMILIKCTYDEQSNIQQVHTYLNGLQSLGLDFLLRVAIRRERKNMKIEHVAIWVKDLEKMKTFYETYFQAVAGEKYHNEKKGFESYFLTFDTSARLEIMRRADIEQSASVELLGWAHIALSLGSKELVDQMTARLKRMATRL